MGVDCALKVDGRYYLLDRWHVFSDTFRHGETTSRRQALDKVEACRVLAQVESADENAAYKSYWVGVAEGILLASINAVEVTMYADHDLPYDFYRI